MKHGSKARGVALAIALVAGLAPVASPTAAAAEGDTVVIPVGADGVSYRAPEARTTGSGSDRAGSRWSRTARCGSTTSTATGCCATRRTGRGSSRGWAPGVAAAAYAAKSGAQVVLGTPTGLPTATARWLQGASSPRPLMCGPLTTRATCDIAAQALGHDPR